MGKVLNLGAGKSPIKDAVNHDITKHSDFISIVWDLNKLPWPWKDNSFDKIVAWAVLEHLDISLVQSMNECWRILRPGGIIALKVPYWDSEGCWNDPTHKRGYTLQSMDYFDPDTKFGTQYNFYTPFKWKGLKKGFVKGSNKSIRFELRVKK
jgi:predicted SAM-dependent methyltransferase